MSGLIQNKLVMEVEPAKFLSLGFGDIAHSEADVVCVSSFREPTFVHKSSISAIDRVLGRGKLRRLLQMEDHESESCTLLDVSRTNVSFRKVLVMWMGTAEEFWERGSAEQSIQFGLQAALGKIRTLGAPTQIDITALGTQYGGLNRRRIFDLLVSWAADVFKQCSAINHLRLVAYDLDTFVDFFEALYRLKGLAGKQISLESKPDYRNYGEFESEVSSAAAMLDQNPKQVLVICRTIVEQVVNSLCKQKLRCRPENLFLGTKVLYDRKHIPPQINSFLHTCRVVGNFAVHPDEWEGGFRPSRRDAEVVMVLTLRIIEWFLGRSTT